MTEVSHDIIVCVHNAADDVRLCIESLLKDTSFISSIFLIDDCSNEETRKVLNGFAQVNGRIRIIRSTHRQGYTKTANSGLRESRADIRTLLNSDTVTSPGWSKKILDKFRSYPELGIVGPLSNAASYQSVPSIVGTSNQTAINILPDGVCVSAVDEFCMCEARKLDIPYVPLVHGFCMSITSECIEQVGFFDEENFPRGYGEESDFCIRAADAGFGLGIALDTYIFHSKSKSYAYEERTSLMASGWKSLVAKHGQRRLTSAIKLMENQPSLMHMRKAVERKFYSTNIRDFADIGRGLQKDTSQPAVKAICFYLPQFHPVQVNDENWGEGFTDWTNVVRAQPRFPGHAQPKYPGKFGFYDLRLPQVLLEQIQLAQDYNVSGFCFYYYRFGKERVLEEPLENWLRLKDARFPFCYCWANESWTRAWDGSTSDIIMSQTYDEETFEGLVADIIQAIADDRYITINGRPVFLIYQVAELPDPAGWIKRLREVIQIRSRKDILIGSVYSLRFTAELLEHVDFVVQFPPHRIPRSASPRKTISPKVIGPFETQRGDYYENYDDVVEASLESANLLPKMLLGACPDWDNTPRRQSHAHTLIGSSPEKFKKWLCKAAQHTQDRFQRGEIVAPMMFVNAWNEWAEGAILEPSVEYGCQYLEALRDALAE